MQAFQPPRSSVSEGDDNVLPFPAEALLEAFACPSLRLGTMVISGTRSPDLVAGQRLFLIEFAPNLNIETTMTYFPRYGAPEEWLMFMKDERFAGHEQLKFVYGHLMLAAADMRIGDDEYKNIIGFLKAAIDTTDVKTQADLMYASGLADCICHLGTIETVTDKSLNAVYHDIGEIASPILQSNPPANTNTPGFRKPELVFG